MESLCKIRKIAPLVHTDYFQLVAFTRGTHHNFQAYWIFGRVVTALIHGKSWPQDTAEKFEDR